MLISNHFSLEELTASQHRGIDNTPPPDVVENLKRTAAMLEQMRSLTGCAIHVNSGYRSPELNTAVGGQPSSQHCVGLAADFIVPRWKLIEVARLAYKHIAFDQLIYEFGSWVHLSVNPTYRPARLQALMIGAWTGGKYEPLDFARLEGLTEVLSTG